MFKFLSNNVKKAAVFALTLAMTAGVVFAVPGQAQAAEPKNGIVVDKTATLENNGTYTIKLEAYATGETITTTQEKPTDFVLVLDYTQSMSTKLANSNTTRRQALEKAASNFIDGVNTKNKAINDDSKKHKIAIAPFNGSTKATDVYHLATVTDTTATAMKKKISDFKTNSWTWTDVGMQYAYDELKGKFSDETRNRVVIVFTDGRPTYNEDKFSWSVACKAVNTSLTLKNNGVTVYTIATMDSKDGADPNNTTTDINKFLNALSSNYPKASGNANNTGITLNAGSNKGYYMVANDADQLMKAFEQIKETSTSTSVALNGTAVLKDIMADGFDLSNATATAQKVANAGLNTNGERTWGTATSLAAPTIDKPAGVVSVTGYNYSTEYVRDANNKHEGSKLVVTITGVVLTDDVKLDEQVDTNKPESGIYEDPDSKTPVEKFPQPKTIVTEKLYVVDYAKPFTMAADDWKQTTSTSTLYGSFKKDAVNPKFGKLAGLVYTPSNSVWNSYDTFYAFGKTNDAEIKKASANANGNLWSKVSVLPANNVYYEDEFETDDTGVVGIVYDGDWTVVGEQEKNEEQANTPIHGGWQNVDLADDAGYSNGSSHIAKDTQSSTATFEFYGTGVDVYTRTDTETLTITGTLYKETDGKWKSVEMKIVSNYAEDVKTSSYYQIPTLNFENLDYGHYKVRIKVNDASGTYYLDGIRVYNPLKDLESDVVVQDAYGDELNVAFKEVRDALIEAGTFDGSYGTEVNGVVLIDKITVDDVGPGEFGEIESPDEDADDDDVKTGATIKSHQLAFYGTYGPKNEVYLAPGQGIAFGVVDVNQKICVGLKAPKGITEVTLTNDANASGVPIGHSTDLYYEVTPTNSGLVIIKNTGNNLLAVTRLKYYMGTSAAAEPALASVALCALMDYADEFDTLSMVAYAAAPEEEEPVTPEITEPETTDPEPEEKPEVEIVVPTPETPAAPSLTNTLTKLMKNILNALRRSK